MSRQFTTEAEKALNKAAKFAIRMGQRIVGSEHLLFGLSAAPGVAAKVLKENGMDKERLDIEVREYCGMSDVVEIEPLRGETSPKLEALLLAAAEEAGKMQLKETGTEHMLLAILKDTSCVAYKILLASGAPIQKLYTDIILTTGGDMVQAKNELIASRSRNKKNSGTPTLDQYARDLTQYAKDGKLDPVLNRDDEIESVIGILSRRMKNNPCLIGEPGVGKTAIVEGLASRIVDGAVPDTLEQKRILTLDLSGMVAGSKYRGEFEERIKRALRETKVAGNILLFIDELHTVIGAGGAEGAIDASNILKPAMARGEIQVIGATTREEYRKHIEKDAALERRFQPVVIEEPSAVQTISMLKGLRSRYEEFHKVEITDAAIEAAVQLSERYLNDRYLPDKAIDLIDEASAKFHLQTVYAQSDRTQEYEKEREDLYEQKEQALIAGDLERVRELLAAEKKLEKKIEKEEELKQEQRQKKDKILPSHIAQVVAKWTHIPVEQMEEAEKERLKKLDAILHERVVGQNDAVKAVARAIRRGRVGLKDPKRPIGSFLFLGPTGVGKTELSKALAEAVFGSEKDMIRVDMSEYMEKQSVSKMIGSPPGYVGYEEGGQLSEKVRRKPYSVLLFDEIEKAHPDVFNMLLQVLEDGHITDAHGKKVDFKNTIIIMTSNAGATRIISPKTLGVGQVKTSEEEYKKRKEGVMEEVKHIFKPEFINRVDEMIVFHALNKENIKDITKIMLKQFAKRVKNQMDMELCIADDVVDFISDKGFDKDYGARPIRRALQTELEDVLAEAVLMGDISIGDTVDVSLSCEGTKKKIVVKKKTFADEKK